MLSTVSNNEYIAIVSIAMSLTWLSLLLYSQAINLSIQVYPPHLRRWIKVAVLLACYGLNLWLPYALLTIILFIPSLFMVKWYTEIAKRMYTNQMSNIYWNRR